MNADSSSTEFELTDWTHGALSSDPHHPLSNVSVANSSLSIDMLKGCSLQCAYCHIQGAVRNLDQATGMMPRKTETISEHSPSEVLAALRLHPAYTPDAVISVGTSSTEPFAAPAIQNTIDIMQACLDAGMRNPLWIVTKAGVPDRAIQYIGENSDKQTIIISPTWGGANKDIEPAQNDRFAGVRKAVDAGAKVLLYLRPIVPEWGSDFAKITHILEQARAKIGDGVLAIAPGGLRWTSGVEYGLSKRGIPWPESVPKVDNQKELSEAHWVHIFAESARLFPGVPVIRSSSCGLSHILGRPDIGAKNFLTPNMCASSACSDIQRDLCRRQREILSDPQNHPLLERQVYAAIGRTGLPLMSDAGSVLQWLQGHPYGDSATAIKTFSRFIPHE